jgi:hydrogenase nickel incorporation protein HypB
VEITVLKDIFASNAQVANEIKDLLKKKKIFMIDMMGSPGGGKTTVTDRIIGSLKNKYRIAVIEADISTTKDAEKLAKHDIPIIQIETNLFGGECHVESNWVLKSLEKFDLDTINFVIIENVGNLVCPAEFELGDDLRVVVLSLTEGEDKPAKYPLMFRTSQTVILNKIDLLPHLNYDLNEVKKNIKSVNPDMKVFEASAITGQGFDAFLSYLTGMIDKKIR